ncbi:ADP-ribosylation factor family-domain-containing protein [Aspergillus minisclerotigenes]|uniref:ADP-ribosylation factor n=1 Tax=Aspergillus minisclerotigenes TaxID=656917 RepID=A0A5N6IJQ6_9EURO|nr:ADP-ribosylation factor family-domain-containing protein [Aspergillus minisclerotigenes]
MTKIIMVGLEGAGKTTILNELSEDIFHDGHNGDSIQYGDMELISWDVPRRWGNNLSDIEGIIFVVDSSDRELISDAREELQRLLNKDDLRNATLLVMSNKNDISGAMDTAEITSHLSLSGLTHRNWYIQNTCATAGDGLEEGLEWLNANIHRKH